MILSRYMFERSNKGTSPTTKNTTQAAGRWLIKRFFSCALTRAFLFFFLHGYPAAGTPQKRSSAVPYVPYFSALAGILNTFWFRGATPYSALLGGQA